MKSKFSYKTFTQKEERVNVFTHGLGFILSLFAVFLLLRKSVLMSEVILNSFVVYGITLILVYLSSTAVHSSTSPKFRELCNLIDHIAIDLFIAGTYTPIALLQIEGENGEFLCVLAWLMCVLGIAMKLVFQERAKVFSIINYVAMGFLWLVVVESILINIPLSSMVLFFLGFFFYSTGLIFYYFEKIPFHHGIFHCFMLLGSTCHFIEIYSFAY